MSRSVYNLIKSGRILQAALEQLAEAGFTRIEAESRSVVFHAVSDFTASATDRAAVSWYETRTKVMLQDDEDWIDPEEQPGLYSSEHHPPVKGTFIRWVTPWDISSFGPWMGPFNDTALTQRENENLAIIHASGEYGE